MYPIIGNGHDSGAEVGHLLYRRYTSILLLLHDLQQVINTRLVRMDHQGELLTFPLLLLAEVTGELLHHSVVGGKLA